MRGEGDDHLLDWRLERPEQKIFLSVKNAVLAVLLPDS